MDSNQPDAVRSLHRWGVQTRTDPTVPPELQNRVRAPGLSPKEVKEWIDNRADIMCLTRGRGCAIEVKNAGKGTSFAFARLEDGKRGWAEKFCRGRPFSVEYWIWLEMGTDEPHLSLGKYRPRKTWLVPYAYWLWMESQIRPYQASIPYLAEKGYARPMQEEQLDAVHLLAEFELPWKNAKDKWGIRPTHAFYKMYIEPEPLPLYEETVISCLPTIWSKISLPLTATG